MTRLKINKDVRDRLLDKAVAKIKWLKDDCMEKKDCEFCDDLDKCPAFDSIFGNCIVNRLYYTRWELINHGVSCATKQAHLNNLFPLVETWAKRSGCYREFKRRLK